MLRTILLALACVLVAAPPVMAKKRHGHAHAAKKAKRGKRLVRMQTAAPTRVAAVEQHPAPELNKRSINSDAPSPAAATPSVPAPEPAAAPSPPVAHGPMGPQDSDDEVPGSRMKKR